MDKWYYESDKLIIERNGEKINYTIKKDKTKKDKVKKDKIKKDKKIKFIDNIDIDKHQINMLDLI